MLVEHVERFNEAVRSGDYAPMLAAFAPDAEMAFEGVPVGPFVGREAIAQHVWDESFDAFTNVIDVYIKRLRAKLDAGGAPRLIHTRRGEGYILTAKAQASDE